MRQKLTSLFLVALLISTISCSKSDPTDPIDPNQQEITLIGIDSIKSSDFLAQYVKDLKIDLSDPQQLEDYNKFVNQVVAEYKAEAAEYDTETGEYDKGIDPEWFAPFCMVRIRLKYKSVMPNNTTAVDLTGSIFVNRWSYYCNNKEKGYVLANHFTVGSNAEAPSNSYPPDAWLTARRFIVFMPDNIGLGGTVSYPQAYLSAAGTAQGSVDFFFAAKSWLAKNKPKLYKYVGNRHYNIGFSQGGHSAMAVHRLVEEKYSDPASPSTYIPFKRTIAGGGPYDIVATYKKFVEDNKTGIPAALPLIVIGQNFAENLNIKLEDVFQGELKTKYHEWFVSGKYYNTEKLTKLMGGYDVKVNQILTPEVLDPNNSMNKKLLNAFAKNSLVSGWKPKGIIPIRIFHSKVDDVVPYVNAENMIKFLTNNKIDVDLEVGAYGGHMDSGLYYFEHCLLSSCI